MYIAATRETYAVTSEATERAHWCAAVWRHRLRRTLCAAAAATPGCCWLGWLRRSPPGSHDLCALLPHRLLLPPLLVQDRPRLLRGCGRDPCCVVQVWPAVRDRRPSPCMFCSAPGCQLHSGYCHATAVRLALRAMLIGCGGDFRGAAEANGRGKERVGVDLGETADG